MLSYYIHNMKSYLYFHISHNNISIFPYYDFINVHIIMARRGTILLIIML